MLLAVKFIAAARAILTVTRMAKTLVSRDLGPQSALLGYLVWDQTVSAMAKDPC
jgi:hypothetical protein